MPALIRSPLLLLALALTLAAPAQAGDGVLEISQTCAAVGCFDGDAAGWPVTIDNPGSYRLTSNLDVYVPGGAIEILAHGATVDLGGFGARFCIDPPAGVFCLLLGSDDGIEGASAVDVTVKNGVVQGFRGWGVDLGARARVDGLVVRANLLGGVRVGSNSLVQNNRIGFNQGPGASMSLGTGWESNVLVTNSPDFTGAPLAVGKNVCSDGRTCEWHGPRRFYQTPNQVVDADKHTACAAGFRLAHPAELHDPSALYWDEALAGFSFYSNFPSWSFGNCEMTVWKNNGATSPDQDRWESVEDPVCTGTRRVWCIEDLD